MKTTPGKNTMTSTIETTQGKFYKFFRPIRQLYSKVFNRHSVSTESVGIKYTDDYRKRYEWIEENIPNFKKTVWVNCTVTTYHLPKPHNLSVVSELRGEFRFKYRSDAVAFLLRWA